MNISVISPYIYSYFDSNYGPTPGGAQRQQYLISRQLIDRGHEVSFIVGDFGQPGADTGDEITLIKGAPTNVDGPLSMGSAAIQLLRAMRSANADLFLVRGSPKLTAATYCCAKLLRKPLVFRLANDSDIDPEHLRSRYSLPVRRLYRYAVQGTAAIMAQTAQQRRALKREFDVDSCVVPNAYDLPSEDEIVPQVERETILWVGSSDPAQKKPQRFLELAADLPDESFQMISKRMPDDGGYHEQLREKAEKVPNLDFVGEVSPDAIHEYYRNAKFLVNTSDYEGFPNTFLEAWRYETPVVSLFFDLDEILASNKVGMVSGDLEQLTQDTRRFGKEPDLRSRMGSAARELVANQYSISEVTTKYEKSFEKANSA